jgi:hypothetical protein
METMRRRVAWLSGIANKYAPATTAQHQGAAQPGRSATNDDYVKL